MALEVYRPGAELVRIQRVHAVVCPPQDETPQITASPMRRTLSYMLGLFTHAVIILSMVPVVFLVTGVIGIDFMHDLGVYLSAPAEIAWHFTAWAALTTISGLLSLLYYWLGLQWHSSVKPKYPWGIVLIINAVMLFGYCLYGLSQTT